MSAPFILDGVESIKEIRDNIQLLGNTKAQQTVVVTNEPVDAEFNDLNTPILYNCIYKIIFIYY